uniref:Uncharacterized protein n=1 Tax=Onchocerca volvulus TaxID=6282 RepID=A0A8R1TS74_ONCVO
MPLSKEPNNLFMKNKSMSVSNQLIVNEVFTYVEVTVEKVEKRQRRNIDNVEYYLLISVNLINNEAVTHLFELNTKY